MVVDPVHPGHVFRGDDSCLPRPFVGNDTAEMDDAVADDDAEALRTPVVLAERIDGAITDVVIIGSGIRDVAGQTRHRLQQVGARYDADDAVPAHHRQALDVIFFHQRHDFLQRGILGDADRLRRHDLGYLAAVLANKIGCSLARTENEGQEAATFALGAEFAAANEIAFRDNADELSLGVHHRKAADLPLQHGVRGLDDRGVGCDGGDWPGHDLVGAHGELQWFAICVPLKVFKRPRRRFDSHQAAASNGLPSSGDALPPVD